MVINAVIVTERDCEDSKATGPDLPRVEVASGHAPVLFSELPPQAIENGDAPVPNSVLPSQDIESGDASVLVSGLLLQDIENGVAPASGSDPSPKGVRPAPMEIVVADREVSP